MRRAILAASVALLSACGRGGSSDDSPSATPGISVPGGTLDGAVPVAYTLAGNGAWDVSFAVSADGGATWTGALPAPGCATTKARPAPGAFTFLWDSVADGAAGPVLLRASIPGSQATAAATIGNAGLVFLDRSAALDASSSALAMPPIHRGHYDLSPTVLRFLDDPAFAPLVSQVPVKSWRLCVGRWEIGPVPIMAPEPASYSTDVNQLRNCSREFYRGPNTVAGAQDPANYIFAYLDAAIAAVEACGAEPYLCFDYTPFTLASNQNPNTAHNHYLADSNLSFSNGIRTSPPADNAVYAEVVKRVVMHVKGTFAGGLSKPLTYVEIGNEPDLPLTYFWTGSRAQFLAMYQACAATLDAEFGPAVKVGAASFAWVPGEADPTFLQDFLSGLGGARLDFLGFHVYQDVPEIQWVERLGKAKALRDSLRPAAELHVPEWGMVLDGGPEFDDMTAAIHHAKALEYMMLFDVKLSHRALVRDIIAAPGGLGLLQAGPVRPKPATCVYHAYERLYETPAILAVSAQSPAGKPMILGGKGATAVTVLFFHEAPPPGEVGRITLTVDNLPFADYTVERRVLTDGTFSAGDGLWLHSARDGTGAFTEAIRFTSASLVEWRIVPR